MTFISLREKDPWASCKSCGSSCPSCPWLTKSFSNFCYKTDKVAVIQIIYLVHLPRHDKIFGDIVEAVRVIKLGYILQLTLDRATWVLIVSLPIISLLHMLWANNVGKVCASFVNLRRPLKTWHFSPFSAVSNRISIGDRRPRRTECSAKGSRSLRRPARGFPGNARSWRWCCQSKKKRRIFKTTTRPWSRDTTWPTSRNSERTSRSFSRKGNSKNRRAEFSPISSTSATWRNRPTMSRRMSLTETCNK